MSKSTIWRITVNTVIPPKNTVLAYFLTFDEFKTADNARNSLKEQLTEGAEHVTLTDDKGKSVQFVAALYLGCSIEEVDIGPSQVRDVMW
jgi:hypothetical protein